MESKAGFFSWLTCVHLCVVFFFQLRTLIDKVQTYYKSLGAQYSWSGEPHGLFSWQFIFAAQTAE